MLSGVQDFLSKSGLALRTFLKQTWNPKTFSSLLVRSGHFCASPVELDEWGLSLCSTQLLGISAAEQPVGIIESTVMEILQCWILNNNKSKKKSPLILRDAYKL